MQALKIIKYVAVGFGAIPVIFGLWLMFSGVRIYYLEGDATGWPTTEGVVESTEVERTKHTDEEDGTYYSFLPHVNYRYHVDGQEYTGQFIELFIHQELNSESEAEAVLKAYPVGKKVQVIYNPEEPEQSGLKVIEGGGLDMALFGLVTVLIGVGFALVFVMAISKMMPKTESS